MLLEAFLQECDRRVSPLPLFVDKAGILCADWKAALSMLLDARLDVAQKAAQFHGMFAQTVCALAKRVRAQTGVTTIGLNGGVFQNRRLTEGVERLMHGEGFTVLIPTQVPSNDAGISYGQIIDFAYRRIG